MTTQEADPPNLAAVPGGRMSEREAKEAALDLVRWAKATSSRASASLKCYRGLMICAAIGLRFFSTAYPSWHRS
jgi:hypothetical protein